MIEVTPFWEAYSALQELASTQVISSQSFAVEATLNWLIENRAALTTASASVLAMQIARNLNTARCRERSRSVLRYEFLADLKPVSVGHAGSAVVALSEIESLITPEEWNLLSRLAAGETYKELSTSRDGSTTLLRVRASRARGKLKSAA